MPYPIQKILSQPPGQAALVLEGRIHTYGTLLGYAAALAKFLEGVECGPLSVVGLLAHKSLTAYATPLAAHLGGRGYMPLHTKFPPARLAHMFRQSETEILVVAPEGLEILDALLPLLQPNVKILIPESRDVAALQKRHPTHTFYSSADVCEPTTPIQSPIDGAKTAYLLFTSGSTGVPKGVPVSFDNLSSYVDFMANKLGLNSSDRCSQTFDLTFDLSVHDLYVTWASGAALYPLSDSSMLSPAKFIRDNKLTAWFSVPSVGILMSRARTLRPGIFPDLRWVLFCGEALPVRLAEAWASAAPQGKILNLYGPTEATIAITDHDWTPASESISRGGVVPLGKPFAGHESVLLSEDAVTISPTPRGELCLSGPQVTHGYLKNPDKTREQFITLPEKGDKVWYRTGDLVASDKDGILHYLGRIDSQVKLNGYRIELHEIDRVLRETSKSDTAITIPFPDMVSIKELVACIAGSSIDRAAILEGCRQLLPSYMVPSRIVFLEEIPLTANGKMDRKALVEIIARQ